VDRYQEFCFADPLFYESPDRWDTQASAWPQTRWPAPPGWTRAESDSWVYLNPDGAVVPPQGWKIHVSACLDDASGALDVVWRYCIDRAIPFKFIATRNALLARNVKYALRGGSGKFVTIYPTGEPQLRKILDELNEELAGTRGPYILSDLRWRAGPLYARYGGFARRYCRVATGEVVPAIADPSGKLVPDERPAVFRPPPWVELPGFLVEQLAALGDGSRPTDFPYEISGSLHYSNGGGVYLGRDVRTGEDVVLKEARPHAGLDGRGVDAVARLLREKEMLTELADLDVVVSIKDHVVLGEHHFLVQQYLRGQRLNGLMVLKHPMLAADHTPDEAAEYTNWALHISDQVADALDRLHERGVVFGDLHPGNVMVEENARIRLIDFEVAYHTSDPPLTAMGAPGYVPPDRRSGPAADRFALGCLRLALFFPLTQLIALDLSVARRLLATVAARFPVPDDFVSKVLLELDLPETPATVLAPVIADLERGEPDWDRLRNSLVDEVLTTATPERTDRLFPGDIYQFTRNGLNLGHGAAGVLYALATTGQGRFPEHEQWLLRAVRAGGTDRHVGLYEGSYGIAYALDRIGLTEEGLEVLDRAGRTSLEDCGSDLYAGLAGIGLTLSHFADRYSDPGLRRRAVRVGELLADRTADAPPLGELGVSTADTNRGGLLQGDSGPALCLLRLFECTGDSSWLDAAGRALARDLGKCVRVEKNGSVQLDERWRVLPYLRTGSAGIGLVLSDYLRHRPNEHLAGILAGIRRAACTEFVIQPGLFNGRAGLIGTLCLLRSVDPDNALEAVIHRHLHSLAWHALDHQGRIAFPGEQLLRLSMDLASGNAGILAAVHVALKGGELLPFLRHAPAPPATAGQEKKLVGSPRTERIR
jgi:hypothetical protein